MFEPPVRTQVAVQRSKVISYDAPKSVMVLQREAIAITHPHAECIQISLDDLELQKSNQARREVRGGF